MSSIFIDDLLAEGKVEGKREGKIESILKTLEIRFGFVPEEIHNKIFGIHDEVILDSLFVWAHKCTDLGDFIKDFN